MIIHNKKSIRQKIFCKNDGFLRFIRNKCADKAERGVKVEKGIR